MSLAAAEIERHGITTGTIVLLREIAARVRPPRALHVPFAHGFPLDRPHDPVRQHRVLEALLDLVESAVPPPPVLRAADAER